MTSFLLPGRHMWKTKTITWHICFWIPPMPKAFVDLVPTSTPKAGTKSVQATQVWDGWPNNFGLSHLIFSIQGNEFWKDPGRWKPLNCQFLPCQHPHFPNDKGCEFHLDASDKTDAQWEMLKSKWCLWNLGINNTPLKLAGVNLQANLSVQGICLITEKPQMCNTQGILLPCSVATSEQILYITSVESRHHHYIHFYLGLWHLLFTITPVLNALKLNILSTTKAPSRYQNRLC